MASAPTIVIAGAGIGGLTAALAIERVGFQVALLEQAAELSDIGAGIQLSPNATRVLLALGLGEKLKPHVVAPTEVRIKTGREKILAHIPLGDFAEERYGAPYWVIHRGDLQSVLADAVRAEPGITLTLGAEVERISPDGEGVLVHAVRNAVNLAAQDGMTFDTHGVAVIGADGLNSIVHYDLAPKSEPRNANRTAWRATILASGVENEYREPVVHLWLGRDAHLVHYPVKGGAAINIVAITRDQTDRADWVAQESTPEQVLAHFPHREWSDNVYLLLYAAERFLRWPLFDRPPTRRWGRGPATLLGDAAHPSLPFLAQGAAMAIEDAAVLAETLRTVPEEPEKALRIYEDLRQPRTARVQRTARRNGMVYHLGGPAAALRNYVLRKKSGEPLLTKYDWLYDWRPDVFTSP